MADAAITTAAGSYGSSGANLLLRFIAQRFIRAVRLRGGFLTRFLTDVSDAIAEMGNIVTVPVSSAVTAQDLTDGDALVMDDTTPTSVNVTMSGRKYHAFDETQLLRAQAGGIAAETQMDQSLASVLNAVEQDIIALCSSFSASVGAYNTAVTEAVLNAAAQSVLAANPPAGDLVGMLRSGSTGWGAATQISNFVANLGSSNPSLTALPNPGMVGHRYAGALWYEANTLPVAGSNRDGCVMARDAIAVAFRPLPPLPMAEAINVVDPESGIAFQVVRQHNPNRLSTQTIVQVSYGKAITKNAFGVLVKH